MLQPDTGNSNTPSPAQSTRIVILEPREADSLATALEAIGADIRHNVRSQYAEALWDGEWRGLDEYTEAAMRDRIAAKCDEVQSKGAKAVPLWYGRERWNQAFNALMERRAVDPFLEWLRRLPPWDRKERIAHLLSDLFGARDDAITRWASGYIGIAAVQRAIWPGAKIDEIPVLIGDGRIGKSAYCAAWTPNHPEWFGDDIVFDAGPQQHAEAMLGKVVVEIPEMAGASRADLGKLKAFITRQDDGKSIRLAYAKRPVPMPRRAALIGTADRMDCLPNDAAGNRRFVPVMLPNRSNRKLETLGAAEHEQWWAEALHRVREGARANLTDELAAQVKRAAADHVTITEIHDILLAAVSKGGYFRRADGRLRTFTKQEVRHHIEQQDCRHNPVTAANALGAMGFRYVRMTALPNRPYRWFHRENTDVVE